MRWCNIGLTIFGLVIGADVIALDPLHLESYLILGLLLSAGITVLSVWAMIDKKPMLWRTYFRMAMGALWILSPMYLGFTRSASMSIITVCAGIYVVAAALWQALHLEHQQANVQKPAA